MNKQIKLIKISIFLMAFTLMFTSCYTTQTTSYETRDSYAVFDIKSDNTNDNFTYNKNGLKITYDFWGDNIIVVMENISDSTIFIDLNTSKISTGKEKMIYNNMVSGSFNVLPIEPGNKVEVNNFIIINSDNEIRIKEKIKEAKHFSQQNLSFKTGDYPIKIQNKINYGYTNDTSNEYVINNDFYSSRVKIISSDDFNHLIEYGKLYNKTYYKTSYTERIDKSEMHQLFTPEQMADIFVTIIYFALIFAE